MHLAETIQTPPSVHPRQVPAEVEARFHAAWPEFAQTVALDDFRRAELGRLDRGGHVYLDYTGLYGDSQVRRHAELLLAGAFGNPHSTNPTSSAATEGVETCRRRVLDFFGASPDEYEVVFTANASHALKLVGEAYPFTSSSRFLLTFDNHNSVNGIRELARARGAEILYAPVRPPGMRIDPAALDAFLDLPRQGGHRLFAYPAQSNFSGVMHPLDWIERAQARGWDVLLDAAAFVPTHPLDLSRRHPDFVTLSFYKMFGYPTGVGALLARKEALARLHRPWFAGGTIAVASVQADRYAMAPGAAAFEDGTLNYLALPAVTIGLETLEALDVATVGRRVRCLTGWLLSRLLELRHGNGVPLVALYGPGTVDDRGGTVALNFRDAAGRLIDHRTVEELANHRRISLRTGCFCNPGAGELALGLSSGELATCFRDPAATLSYDDFRHCIHHEGTGAVRVSLGLGSSLADVEAFVWLAEDFLED